jgi:hypothetical protein
MARAPQRPFVWLTVFALSVIVASSAQAQRRGFGRMFGPTAAVSLAQLSEVQTELKLTDEQKEKVARLNDDFAEERRAARDDAAGDFEKMRKELALLNVEFDKELLESLDDAQQARVMEIYLQVNGPTALTVGWVAEALKLTDEQKTKLEQVLTDDRAKWRESFQQFQGLSEEERTKRFEEMTKAREDALMAVLDDTQKQEFEKMQGEKLEVDLSKLPRPGR